MHFSNFRIFTSHHISNKDFYWTDIYRYSILVILHPIIKITLFDILCFKYCFTKFFGRLFCLCSYSASLSSLEFLFCCCPVCCLCAKITFSFSFLIHTGTDIIGNRTSASFADDILILNEHGTLFFCFTLFNVFFYVYCCYYYFVEGMVINLVHSGLSVSFTHGLLLDSVFFSHFKVALFSYAGIDRHTMCPVENELKDHR